MDTKSLRGIIFLIFREISPCNYSYLIFNKGAKNLQWRKDSLFSKWCWETCISTYRRVKLDPILSHCILNEFQVDQRSKSKTQNIETTKGKTPECIGIVNVFLIWNTITQDIRARVDKGNGTKLVVLCTEGNNHQNQETIFRMGENLCKLVMG
jgi:hypothetical protein